MVFMLCVCVCVCVVDPGQDIGRADTISQCCIIMDISVCMCMLAKKGKKGISEPEIAVL